MSTVQSILEAAYSRSSANDAGKLAVDGEMIAFLNREYQLLFAILSNKSGDNLAASGNLSFSGTPATATLPTDIVDIIRIETGSGGRTYLIPINEKDRTIHLAPAMYRQGNSIISRNQTSDPIAGDTYKIFYKDAPATLTALANSLDARFPVRYEGILVIKCAIYLAVKDENRDAGRIGELRGELTMALEALGLLTTNANTARESISPAKNAPSSAT